MKDQLPASLRKEIEGLYNFDVQPLTAQDQQVTLAARVRQVPIWIRLDPASYPLSPPEISLAQGWSWGAISAFEHERRISGLSTQVQWNRTLGLATLLRDLELSFRRESPVHHQPSAMRQQGVRLQTEIRRAADSFMARLKTMGDWLRLRFVRQKLTPPSPGSQIRADYQLLIEEKTSRLERYREALAKLESQSKNKKTLREAEKFDQKLAEYKQLLKTQVRDIEDLRQEAQEVEAELTLTDIEQEIVDIRVGVDRSDLARQREAALRSVREKRAKLRISKRLAAATQEDNDAEYLERGQHVEAAPQRDVPLESLLEDGEAY